MSVGLYSQLMLILLLVICCLIGQQEIHANRHRRQAGSANTRNIGIQSGNPNNAQFNPPINQNNQPPPSSQGQGQPIRSRGFYSSPDFKPPTFSGEKPVGWFDTKYQNWVSNKDGSANQVDGKNAPPSNLQGKGIQSSRQNGGEFLLEKVARQYADKGEKTYNFGQFNQQSGRGSVCINRHSYNGYTFNKFHCPLPANTGMNQLDRFCCGIANYQYCCNEQEYNQNLGGGFEDGVNDGKHRHNRKGYYPSKNRALAIILPIVSILVVAGAGVIIFLYYKKTQNTKNKDGKSPSTIRKNDKYSAVAQDLPIDKPIVPPREHKQTTVQD